MRVFSIVSIVIFSLGQAMAQDLPKDDDELTQVRRGDPRCDRYEDRR
jgi:hypothetical protein